MSEPADDDLKLDLSAWEAPEPPQTAEELADVVVARLGGTEVGAAIPVEESVPTPRRRALLIGGVAAAVIAIGLGAWGLVRNTQHAAPAEGFVRADKAQSLQLDSASAELDPGADVRWHRHGSVLDVEQRAGNATWRVGTEQKLVIDAGATVASVEATGASLRVEVQPMNAADVRVIGATALTAAAVSIVTVVVYEGHVKVHGNQQTVIVEPGSTYKVTPPSPVTVDEPVVGVGPIAASSGEIDVVVRAGESATILDPAPPTAVKIDTRTACGTTSHVTWTRGATQLAGIDALTALDTGTYDYELDCDGEAGKVTKGTITVRRDDLRHTLPTEPVRNPIAADGRVYRISYQRRIPDLEVSGGVGGLHLQAAGGVERTFEADQPGKVLVPGTALAEGTYTYWFTKDKVSTLTIEHDNTAPVIMVPTDVAWGSEVDVAGMTFAATTLSIDDVEVPVDGTGRFMARIAVNGRSSVAVRLELAHGHVYYAVVRPAKPRVVTTTRPKTYSDVITALKPQIDACDDANPSHGVMKLSVRIRPDGSVKGVEVADSLGAGIDECIKKVVAAATFPTSQSEIVVTVPISLYRDHSPAPPTNCDADALKDKGMENVNTGQHAAALALFEASLRCKGDPYVVELAMMSACNSRNQSKAQHYYEQLTEPLRSKLKLICTRNKVVLTAPNASSCDADTLKDKGMENVNMGQHAAALAQFEASLRCKNDPYVIQLAFMTACNAQNQPKAQQYFDQLDAAQRSKYEVFCTRNKIALTEPGGSSPAATSCSADKLKDKGMDLVNLGKHAEALAQFENSLRCADDPYVRSLAFMAACNSQNKTKANTYYRLLGSAQQDKLKVMCERNHIALSLGPDAAVGYLVVHSNPEANIQIDGKDTGLTTPITGDQLPLDPGKHKVTFVIGQDRFTYSVVIKSGSTESMTKDLQ